jgi:hypothetical protein
VLDVALAINQRADLPPGLVREFRELAREFGRDDLLRRNAPRVELLDAAQLVGLETLRVAFYVADTSDLLRRRAPRTRIGVASRVVGLVGLEFERSERLGADAVRLAALMLPCENTSLDRAGETETAASSRAPPSSPPNVSDLLILRGGL